MRTLSALSSRAITDGWGGLARIFAQGEEGREIEVKVDTIIQVVTTGDSRNLMERIGRSLVEKGLVSCAQIGGPIKSIYRWKGKIEENEEWTCTLKSIRRLYGRIEAEIKSLHPYETPEIVAFELVEVLTEYKTWVTEETVQE